MKPTFCDLRPLPTSPQLSSGHRLVARCARCLNRRPIPQLFCTRWAFIFIFEDSESLLSPSPRGDRLLTFPSPDHKSRPLRTLPWNFMTHCIQLLGPSSHCVPLPSDAAIYISRWEAAGACFLFTRAFLPQYLAHHRCSIQWPHTQCQRALRSHQC